MLLSFLFLSVYFLSFGLVYFVFVIFFVFSGLNVFSWSGIFVFFDSYIYLMLLFMSVFIIGLILLSEGSLMMLFLSEVLVLVCVVFFVSVNVIMMYFFFELSIFPILIMILGYGSQVEKIGASYYLVFYAVMCSMPFLYVFFVGDFYLFFCYFDMICSWEMLFVLTLCFLVKFPVFFLHLWLPKAHVEAPTTASMLLAGLLLKLGTGGYLRLMGMYCYVNVVIWGVLSLLGMILGSFLCLFQSDSKSVAAYSSIVHMGFVLMSLVLMMKGAKMGAGLMMLSHGYVSTLMFYLVGEVFHKSGSRMMNYLSGFFLSSILFCYMMSMVFLCNSGLPPSMSFFSEYVGVVSMFMSWFGVGFLLFIYFFVSFYFSVFFLTSSFMGGDFKNLSFFLFSYVLPSILLIFNSFWFGLLLWFFSMKSMFDFQSDGMWNQVMIIVLSFFSLFFKWRRLIYILMSFEFILLGLFVVMGGSIMGVEMLFFISFSVVSSLLGLVVMVMSMKNYGSDLCVF